MTQAERLSRLVAVWWEAVDSFTQLLEEVGEDQWRAPTDLPGWDVHAVAAHTAHLEALLAGRPHDDVEVADAPHAHGAMGQFTEQGVLARRQESPDALIVEIRESATARHTQLLADPPSDPDAPAPGVFGAIGWSTGLLLRNRPLDVWMHEQDVRRAIGRPGNLDSAPAVHAVDSVDRIREPRAARAGRLARRRRRGDDLGKRASGNRDHEHVDGAVRLDDRSEHGQQQRQRDDHGPDPGRPVGVEGRPADGGRR